MTRPHSLFRLRGVFGPVLTGVLLSSCFTTSTLHWMENEVVYLGARLPAGPTHELFFSIKNIEGVPDELEVFEIALPADWPRRIAAREEEGGFVLDTPLFGVTTGYGALDFADGSVAFVLSRRDTRRALPPRSPSSRLDPATPRYGYRIHRRRGFYSVSVYGELVEKKRWVLLGTFAVGEGKQLWLRKWVGVLALPPAFALDVVSLSLLFVLLDDSTYSF